LSILKKINLYLKEELPFVAYRKPNSTILKGVFQNDNILNITKHYNGSGFIFAPFDNRKEAILIPWNNATLLEEKINYDTKLKDLNNFYSDTTSKSKHIEVVKRAIKAIKTGIFKKVVLSRKEIINLSNFDAQVILQTLLNTYNNALVYIWYHPKVGLWLGATPETLVKINGTKFETMSLAGTQPFTPDKEIIWQSKEIEEQQLVTDYITNKLKKICKKVSTNKTETVKAGNLLHLKTKISGIINNNTTDIIKTLHPTPAVCGYPKNESQQFILENEGYDRLFYTGFLGELNLKDKTTELFVNLRCMQIENNLATIYVGGGITQDSIPEKEWDETVAKTLTMKKVL